MVYFIKLLPPAQIARPVCVQAIVRAPWITYKQSGGTFTMLAEIKTALA